MFPGTATQGLDGNIHADVAVLRRDLARHALPAAVLLALVTMAVAAVSGFGEWYAVKAVGLFALCVWAMRRGLAWHRPHTRLGPANRVTLGRLALVLLLAAGIGEPLAARDALAWAVVVLATVTAVLDAADGPLARRSGLASAFGARFDMETDALLVAVLALLVWQFDKAGAWVLLAGALRYAFVAAAAVWPWMNRTLPDSIRRKTVCVVQITALIVCLGPVITPFWSAVIAASTLAALVCSFAVDVAWLARRRHQPLEHTP